MKTTKTVKTFPNNPPVEEHRFLFLFEVTGISQLDTNNLNYPIRQSSNPFIAVP
jgi:hypothetical protein